MNQVTEPTDQSIKPSGWPYPDSLDALMAAPDHHTLLMENDRVRVLETLIPPGDITPIHTHRWPSVYYMLSWSDFVRTDDHGRVMADSRQSDAMAARPVSFWDDALPPHALENVGDAPIRLISVELK